MGNFLSCPCWPYCTVLNFKFKGLAVPFSAATLWCLESKCLLIVTFFYGVEF